MKILQRVMQNPFLIKYTWQIEASVVGLGLLVILILAKQDWPEYVGSVAVMATFLHGQVGDRLAYSQDKKKSVDVPCYKWLWRYYVTKEITWVCYFFILNAWSALFGAILFLIYPLWRKLYHSYNPGDD